MWSSGELLTEFKEASQAKPLLTSGRAYDQEGRAYDQQGRAYDQEGRAYDQQGRG